MVLIRNYGIKQDSVAPGARDSGELEESSRAAFEQSLRDEATKLFRRMEIALMVEANDLSARSAADHAGQT